jgi:hypothetical protein
MRVSLKYDLQLSEIVCQITNTLAQEYEDIKARKTSQRSNQVSSVATLSLNGIMKIQNEGRDNDPSYRAIPFYFTPPHLFTMNCTNFGASNFSQFHQKLYPSVFTNLEPNKELSSLKEKFLN